MDQKNSRRYKKLQIKRKQVHSNTHVENNSIPIDLTYEHEGEHFKMKRFLKDVKRYRGQSPIEDVGNIACESVSKSCKENVTDYNVSKIRKDTLKGSNHNKKDGLFMRGVISKCFNKGLMPPSLNARMNEDLLKMIELANGKTYKKCEKLNDEISIKQLPKVRSIDKVLLDIPCTEVTSPINTTESEVLGNDIEDNKNKKPSSDLYLQFTHFVTKSLLNSGIDKQEIKSYSDSLKESLVKIYHARPDNRVIANDSSDNYSTKLTFHEIETPVRKTVNFCPSTSRSEDGPKRTKSMFASDSQLSDDIVYRKPSKMLYTSGLDYLKSVYQSKSSKPLLNIDSTYFSPVQENKFNGRSSYFNSNQHECSVSYRDELTADDSRFIYSDEKENIICDYSHIQNPSTSLQYFSGNQTNLWNNFTTEEQIEDDTLILNKQPENKREPEESPKYISLLPSNRRFQNRGLDNLYNGNYCSTDSNLGQSIDQSLHQSLFSLPLRIPPMASPEFQYAPRKMF